MCVCLYINLCVFFVHFSPLSLPCQRRVGGAESRKSKRRIMETQVSASVSISGRGREVWATKPLWLFLLFSFLSFFLMQPGKQLSAIQITCQSDCDEGSFRSLDQSACLLTPSAAQCLFPSPSPSLSFFSPPVCLMPADALESVLKSKGSAREMKCHVFGSV